MNQRFTIASLLYLLATFAYGQAKDANVPMAPKQNRKPENYQLAKYKYSLEELKDNFSEELMQLGNKQYEKILETNNECYQLKNLY
jgi:hypothetical protein